MPLVCMFHGSHLLTRMHRQDARTAHLTACLHSTGVCGSGMQVLAWHTPGTESYVEFADGIPSRKRMEEVLGMYLADGDSRDPLAFPLNAADLSGLPPALILVAERDVLRDEAEAYGARLLAAR